MHSFWYRANALLTFAATVLAGMALCATFTDYLHKANPTVECSFSGVEGLQREFGHDRAYIVLNVTADLSSEFTWNTKQIYVYISVEFETRKNARNQMVLWNSIAQSKEEAVLSLPTLRQQYPFAVTDQGFNLRGREFNVTVAWNMMPRVGALYTRRQTFSGFRLPEDYIPPSIGNLHPPGSEDGAGDDEAAAS